MGDTMTAADGRESAAETADYEWVNAWAEQGREPSRRPPRTNVITALFGERARSRPRSPKAAAHHNNRARSEPVAPGPSRGPNKHVPPSENANPIGDERPNETAAQLARDISEIESARVALANEPARVRLIPLVAMPWSAERHLPAILGTAIALLTVAISITIALLRMAR
jgi:hypothetical protein